MAGNGRRSRSRWDNAANVAPGAPRGSASLNREEPPQTRRLLRFQKHPGAATRSLGKLVPLPELLVSFCGWFVSTSLNPCVLTEKAQAALAILPELDDPLGRRGKWLSPSRSF